jgi:uncharacterized phage protein gp47/JayE
MPVLLARDQEKILGEVLYDVTTATGFTRSSPGSKLRALSEALAKQLGRMYINMDSNLINAFLAGASGRYLEFFGEMLAIQRLGITKASVAAAHKNFKFYVDTGTFGDINGTNSFIIPAGTIISTQSAGDGIRFKVTYDTTALSTNSVVYVAAEAQQPGEGSNVGSGMLRFHNFSSYADIANKTLQVTNLAEVTTGQEVETDENYRFRLSNSLLMREQANKTAIRIAALSVPGVADMVFMPFYRGMGTYDLLIKSLSPHASAGLIAAVQEAVDLVTAQGVLATVRAPKEIGLSLAAILRLSETVSLDAGTEIVVNARRVVGDFVNNLDIGQELVLNEIVRRLLTSDSRVRDMGTYTKPFENLFLYRPTLLEDNKIRATLTQNYIPAIDERVIIETEEDIGDPISIKIEGLTV